jgi:hypothetical protein
MAAFGSLAWWAILVVAAALIVALELAQARRR